MLWYAHMEHNFELLKVEDLPFTILLGRDAPGFGALFQAALQELSAAIEELSDGEEGPSSTSNLHPDAAAWTIDPDFLQAHKDDDTLGRLWDDHAVCAGTPVDEHRASQFPQLEV